jgi:excisionase family DNA binding protein
LKKYQDKRDAEELRQDSLPAISFSIPEPLLQAIEDRIVERLFEKLKAVLKDKDSGETVFTVETLAQYLQVDISWVYKQVSLNGIPFFKVGKYTRFQKKKINEWIEKHAVRIIPKSM